MKGGLVLIHLVQGIKQAGLRLFGTKSRERRARPHSSGKRNKHVALQPSIMKSPEWGACPCPSGMWKQVGRTSSVRYEVAQKESLSTSVRYDESCWQDFVCLVRSSTKGELILVRPVHGIKQAGLRLSGTKLRERTASPRRSDTKSSERRACPCPTGTRNHADGTTSIRHKVMQGELVHVRPV